MRRVLIMTAAVAVLAVPLTGVASAKTSQADKREARKECRDLRGDTDASREAFKALYRNFGACVSQKAHEAKAERKQAKRSAARDCRDERSADPAAFKEKYGTNGNKSNAFGKCVSQTAKAKREAQDEQDEQEAEDENNAAQQCATERSADRQAFEDKYGTNHNKKNAFGKCVSQKVREAGDEDGGEDAGS
jgi:hypothetical protein